MKKLLVFILSICVVALTQTSSSEAQVSNQSDVYANISSCAAYEGFLAATTVSVNQMSTCDSKTVFLIENGGAGISAFLRAYISKSQEGSPLYTLAEALLSTVRSFTYSNENINSFFALGVAETLMYSAFSMGADDERAILYSSLLFDTKMRMLLPELKQSSQMAGGILSNKVKVSELLGVEFESFDSHTADSVLICLLKTDNFRVSVLRILRSQKMADCLKRNS